MASESLDGTDKGGDHNQEYTQRPYLLNDHEKAQLILNLRGRLDSGELADDMRAAA